MPSSQILAVAIGAGGNGAGVREAGRAYCGALIADAAFI